MIRPLIGTIDKKGPSESNHRYSEVEAVVASLIVNSNRRNLFGRHFMPVSPLIDLNVLGLRRWPVAFVSRASYGKRRGIGA
jgi:hypothetical protein